MKIKNSKIIIVTLIFAVIFFASVFLRFENSSSKAEFFQLRNNIKTEESIPDEVFISRKMEDLNVKNDLLKSYLFDSSSPVDFIKTIEGMAESSGVEVFVEDVGESNDDSEFKRIILSISGEGSLENIEDLIIQIEEMREMVFVENVRVTRVVDGTKSFWKVLFSVTAITK